MGVFTASRAQSTRGGRLTPHFLCPQAADANRANVPWVIVTSHFPLLHTMLAENKDKSAEHYIGLVSSQAICGCLWFCGQALHRFIAFKIYGALF